MIIIIIIIKIIKLLLLLLLLLLQTHKENIRNLCGQPLAYIHEWKWRENFINKFGGYKDGVDALAHNLNSNTPK